MAWNHYKNVRRKVGVHLRMSELSDEILAIAPKDEIIDFVAVSGRCNGRATLRVWSHRRGNFGQRHTVSLITVDEDPNWIVER